MTWESTACFGFVVVCSTIIYCFQLWIQTKQAKTTITREEFEELQNAASVIVADHEAIQKLAEETKKLLSQANLAQGFRRTPSA